MPTIVGYTSERLAAAYHTVCARRRWFQHELDAGKEDNHRQENLHPIFSHELDGTETCDDCLEVID